MDDLVEDQQVLQEIYDVFNFCNLNDNNVFYSNKLNKVIGKLKVDLVAFSLEVDNFWALRAEAYVFFYGSREICEGC